jgi:hypothetical protein
VVALVLPWEEMAFTPNEDTMARPRQTILAAELFHSHADVIARSCALASADETVLAGVDRFLSFSGAWSVRRSQLVERAAEFDQSGWTLVFSPGTELREVEERSMELARHAFRRWEALRRWSSKHRD